MTRTSDQQHNETATAPAHSQLVTQLERSNRALRTLSAGNHTLLHALDEHDLLHEMCRVIVEKGGYRQACVGYARHDADKTIQWMACVGIEEDLLDTLQCTWADTELGRTGIGTAIRTGVPCVGRHLLTDPSYASPAYQRLRDDAAKRDYASVTAFPLRVGNAILGALVMAAQEPDAFDQEEVALLNELAADLAYGIDNLRMRIERREAQAALLRLAYQDSLTDLPNRASLHRNLESAMAASRAQHRALALLHLEVGHFQEINQVLGHRASDQLLRELARRLAAAVSDEQVLARIGDAQFALLLPNANAESAAHMARRLVALVQPPVEVESVMIDAQVGIGIALFPGHANEPDALLRRANAARHQGLHQHSGYAIYTGGQEQESTRRLKLMGDLRRAIEHDELLLYCQPKVDFATRRVCGSEALVRWRHPQHGLIATGEFIKLAEQARLITPLTNWVLEAAFSRSHAWHDAGLDLALSVNLSAQDLQDPGLVQRIQRLFSTWGVPPGLIQFELTESALMEDPDNALATLRALKDLNVKLSIDDFGTGYSSLSYLQRLPVDSIKIDQSFVMPMIASRDSEVIVHSTIELGHNLGLQVVAEGVESQAIWERLAELGCDVAQGYLVSMPMPAEQFAEWEHGWAGIPA
jgi:diguanylate cyclase (GGDEF)-like protein